jgi:hypothetical protein
MSTIDIVLIILAVVVGLPFAAIYFRRRIIRHIQTHAHPELARLRWLWVQFWLFAAFAAAYCVGEGVMLTRGEDKAPAFAVFWVVLFAWTLISTYIKIRGCQKEITNHDA